MINNKNRIGRFTSSQIWRLMTNGRAKGEPGKPYYEYIEEKRMERRLGRSLGGEIFSYPTSWGHCVEGFVFKKKLPMSYKLLSKETVVHPDIDCWAGSPDLVTGDSVGDIKSPYTLKSFCKMVDADNPEDMPAEYFWQLISNAVLKHKKYAELIVYAPYFTDLIRIQDYAAEREEYNWITLSDSDRLPWIHQGGYYRDLNTIRFDADPYKDALNERVLMAEKELMK